MSRFSTRSGLKFSFLCLDTAFLPEDGTFCVGVRVVLYIRAIAHFQRWIFREVNDSYPAVGEPKFAEHFSSDEVMAEPIDRFARSFGREIRTQSGV